ncbi:hypothetical protein GCM10007881_61400 [Mesorhizobium huakuii]|uniref:hypothetical protein n=1 Tax=Mesorhizobium huakuii TaxID=28104 RepID=UPI00235C5FC9|nr:hypothetical protein [Mesorhizobium huakuii]GLQ82617.1 hypothetical protein GCM10007881_61400 [Mesorhizobium huakuii]
MSDSSTMDDPMLYPVPLTSVRAKGGGAYNRFRDVEEEITQILRSGDPATLLLGGSLSTCKSQTLVYFARHSGTDRHLVGQLVHEIMSRAAAIVAKNSRGFSDTDVEIIAGGVRVHLVTLLFADPSTRMSENLEVDFHGAVRQQTIKEQRPFKDVPTANKFDTASTTADGSDPLDDIPEKAASTALDELIRKTSPPQVRQLLKAIKDPKHRKAFILRKLRDWPMTSADPSMPTVTKYFGLRPEQARTVQYWIDRAIKEMREAFGEPS